eukprot:gene8558-7810_t
MATQPGPGLYAPALPAVGQLALPTSFPTHTSNNAVPPALVRSHEQLTAAAILAQGQFPSLDIGQLRQQGQNVTFANITGTAPAVTDAPDDGPHDSDDDDSMASTMAMDRPPMESFDIDAIRDLLEKVITDTGAHLDTKGRLVVAAEKYTPFAKVASKLIDRMVKNPATAIVLPHAWRHPGKETQAFPRGRKFLQGNTPITQKDVYLALILSTLQGVAGVIPDPTQEEDNDLSPAAYALAQSAYTPRTATAPLSAPPGFFAQPSLTTKLLPTDLLSCLLFRLLLAYEAPPWQACADWAHERLTCASVMGEAHSGSADDPSDCAGTGPTCA